ncbi:PhoX family phosphatase [Melaminivora sp.]
MNAPTTRPRQALIDPDDQGYNRTANPSLNHLIEQRLSRRSLLRGGMASAGGALLGSLSLAACGGGSDGAGDSPAPLQLGFNPVAKSLADAVIVPAGYSASVLFRLGDPMAAGVPEYRNDGTDEPGSYDRRAGDHHDGMTWFGLGSGDRWEPRAAQRGLLVQNHEAITPVFLHPNGQTIRAGARSVPGEVLREFYLHGVSIIETSKGSNGQWSYQRDSRLNRRVHTLTPMELSGPAKGSAQLVTAYDPQGGKVRGTLNNCANGSTPWGTYLTCEENWAGYFRLASTQGHDARTLSNYKRYGVSGEGRELWATTQGAANAAEQDSYDRWNAQVRAANAAQDYRYGPNTYGWVVEIDPFNPNSTPKKRTALGRFGHEGAALGPVQAGQPLVWYMGDDARNEYVYKFVSDALWDSADLGKGLAAGDKYLDKGKLYVARFNEDGSGEWLHLSLANPAIRGYAGYAFADEADVYINARHAADAVGATKMDRPEWTSINPLNGDVYLTLTNNNASNRALDKTNAANPRSYNDPKNGKDQKGNPNGHVLRFADAGRNPAATRLTWDVYLFGARASAPAQVNLSGLTADNDFSSPDGLWFSQAAPGLLWLETDDGAYTDVTNCMLLAAVPGQVGDGAAKTIVNQDGDKTREQKTFIGARPGEKNTQLKRFLVGPKGCEITGIAESGDGRALFVNIQHPGEDTAEADIGNPARYQSHWPDGGNARPRSATLVITRNDGGLIGL